jgi:lipopolysaccharide/colanic/teichoic acid biosynthesis glycosyltransferase
MIAIAEAPTPRGATYARIDTRIPRNPRYYRAKRVFDLIVTSLLLIPLILITAIVAILIRLDSKGPVFFRQKRIGQYGVEFELLKFRSMHVDADDSVHRAAYARLMRGERLSDGPATTTAYKLTNDPRVTRVGRVLRKTGLDELPQLWNVLRGDMSLVGPRPPLAYEVAMYSERDLLRLSGKPGITGTWQVYGRSRVTFRTMVDMDVAYLRQQSLWYDLKLMLVTIPVLVLSRGGA